MVKFTMPKLYSEESILEMESARDEWIVRSKRLCERALVRSYPTTDAAEYARHGVNRRLRSLRHYIDRVFDLIAPDMDHSPSSEALLDATAFIHSFIVNVYGAIDNFARIWCLEVPVKNKKGELVRGIDIGFRPKNTYVRDSLPDGFKAYLKECDPWFEYLENYRHAVAHRIPVYIPPKTLNDDERKQYTKLQTDIDVALKSDQTKEVWRLFEAQRKLGVFKPLMMHSFGENAQPVWFHGQMICDLATVVKIGEKTLDELDSCTKMVIA